jgi:hypothetical protein
MKGRNPKAEDRRPKTEGPGFYGARLSPAARAAERIGRAVSSFVFRISAFFRPSTFGLRTLAVGLCLLAAQPALAAATNSLAPDDIPPLRPPHAEIPPTFWEQHAVWLVLFGALLLALVGVAAWFLTRPKPPVIVPPEVQARQALDPLRQQPEDGALLSRVSQILRHYVAAAFGLPPGELTTAEFCRAIAGHTQIGPELAAALSDFLRLCDQDKFSLPAPVPPLSAVAQALKLIDHAQNRRLALVQPANQLVGNAKANPPTTGVLK